MGFIFSKPDPFLSQAKSTSYGSVLKERMVFAIYLHRGGIKGGFHDSMVVSSAKYGMVTLELSVNEEGEIVPKCQQFNGSAMELNCQKEVECTFKDLAEIATEILKPMAASGYSLKNNNCQDFCNKFLKVMDAPQYKTTSEIATSATGIGIVQIAMRWAWTYLTWGSTTKK